MKAQLFLMDLLIMIAEMCIVGSIVFFVVQSFNSMNPMLWFVFIVNLVMWLYLLMKSLIEMKDHLGD